jgi:hypothetical protein
MKSVRRAAGGMLAFALAGSIAYTTSAAALFTTRATGSTETVTLTGSMTGSALVRARMAGTPGFVTLQLLNGDASVTAQVFGLDSSGNTISGCGVAVNGPPTGGDPLASFCSRTAVKYTSFVFFGN